MAKQTCDAFKQKLRSYKPLNQISWVSSRFDHLFMFKLFRQLLSHLLFFSGMALSSQIFDRSTYPIDDYLQ